MAGHMSSTRKEHVESSSSNKRLLVEDADKLSTLPLEIQSQILSFLPTIDAAKVGLLSKMWRTAWYSVSKLAFNYCEFPETENKLDTFVNFINQTLAYHYESDVRTFEVWLWPFIDCDVPIKTRWITFSILHKVEKLVLYGEIDDTKLPNCLCSCQSLVKLELAIPDLVLPSETFALPNLRKLKLRFLVLSELISSQDLFSNLPALEKLSIISCYVGYSRDISISSTKLTEFIICGCPGMESCSFKLQNPFLSSFIYISNASETSELEVPSNLFQFVINGGVAHAVSESTYELSRSVIKVTRELLKSTVVSLSHWLIEYLSTANDLPRQVAVDLFHNVTKLDISIWPVMEHIRVSMLLVSRCPNLTELSLVLVTPQGGALHLPSEDLLVDYGTEGGFHTVNDVRVENFGGDEIELILVRFLLANMIELRLMRIVMNIFMVKNDMKMKISKILEYQKASAFADVIFD